MVKAYANIPGVEVESLKFGSKSLNIGSMLALMSVDSSQNPPLYIQQVGLILRDIASSTKEFDYIKFKDKLNTVKFSPQQKNPLDARLALLESFIELDGQGSNFEGGPGTLTIVDLTCPF